MDNYESKHKEQVTEHQRRVFKHEEYIVKRRERIVKPKEEVVKEEPEPEPVGDLLFGTSGIPKSTKIPSTVSGIERIKELDLDCMEIEFRQGVRMSEVTAETVRETAQKLGIRLSTHAPYFINFNAHHKEDILQSQQRLMDTAYIGALCRAETVNFHAAFYVDDSPGQTYKRVTKNLGKTLIKLREVNNKIRIRPEVTGKASQFGNMEELLKLSTEPELESVAPALNFAHLHGRTGKFNSYLEFATVLKQVEERLGRAALDDIYIVVCGINFAKDEEAKKDKLEEVQHLNLRESDFNYIELLQALKDFSAKGMVICESPNREEDALLLKRTYLSLPQHEEPVIEILPEVEELAPAERKPISRFFIPGCIRNFQPLLRSNPFRKSGEE